MNNISSRLQSCCWHSGRLLLIEGSPLARHTLTCINYFFPEDESQRRRFLGRDVRTRSPQEHPSAVFSCRDRCQAAVVLLNMHGEGSNVQAWSSKKHFSDIKIKVPFSRVPRTVAPIPRGTQVPNFVVWREGEIRHLITLMDLSLYLLRSRYQTQSLASQIPL